MNTLSKIAHLPDLVVVLIVIQAVVVTALFIIVIIDFFQTRKNKKEINQTESKKDYSKREFSNGRKINTAKGGEDYEKRVIEEQQRYIDILEKKVELLNRKDNIEEK